MDLDRRGRRPSMALNKNLYMGFEEIVREHLILFLPAKSLLKFRSVCRDWKHRISNPFFAHHQSYFFRSVSGLFHQQSGKLPSFVSLDPNSSGVPDPSLQFLPVPVDIKSSSNGLLCCQARSGNRGYYICNPVNKQWKMLPKSICDHGPDPALVLIYEPSLLNFSADYKLICAFPSSEFDDGLEFDMYSSETGAWKVSGEICFGRLRIVAESGVHVRGVVYWKTDLYIVAFDLSKDRSRLLQSAYNGILGEVCGKLCNANVSDCAVRVQTLENTYSNTTGSSTGTSYMKTWSDKLCITLQNATRVVFVGGDAVVVQKGWDTNMVCYAIKTKETTVVPNTSLHGYNPRFFPYVNSLVSLA
ncbi:hypothetical protein GIB67_017508 [Kingdonia uniflora]|uniref:F-box protein n=1 Tax=Kingdonia uniflora TaxID=39325 RepID=A0A7J7M4I2_9MAGN|nr:hypothetical protein GIB67_017508 [Kingdonia uniflora]